MPQPILLTAADEDAGKITSLMDSADMLHLPLEVYTRSTDDTTIAEVLSQLDTFDNIVHSNIRNAQFFLEHVKRHSQKEAVTDCLNFTFDEGTFTWLEEQGIPAVHPQTGQKPIDLIELMLRLQRMGKTLYPCGSHQREDFPGFLEELDIEVTELDVFDLKGPGNEALDRYQRQVAKESPQAIIFHSRRSVTRTLAAFPNLDYQELRLISADRGITNKLEENGLAADAEAGGSWESIADLLDES